MIKRTEQNNHDKNAVSEVNSSFQEGAENARSIILNTKFKTTTKLTQKNPVERANIPSV